MFHKNRNVHRAVTTVAGLAVLALSASPALSPAARGAPALAPQPQAAVTASFVPAAPAPLTITTDDPQATISHDTYLPGSMTLEGVDYRLQIKGRGHSTWSWPKKPYKLKLDSAASLFGLPSDKEWVLLANFADRASLRNYLALALGQTIDRGTEWTPRTHFVDLALNGVRQGTYLMTEQIKQAPARVNLPTGGLLLELDDRFETLGDPGFRSSRQLPFTFNDPKPPDDPNNPKSGDLTAEQVQQAQDAVNGFEKVLYGSGFKDPDTGYRKYVDMNSFVDWYVVNELFKTVDADFWSSVYITWDPSATEHQFAMGPPWDFDLSGGYKARVGPSVQDPTGWWVRAGESSTHAMHDTHWIARMFLDPYFEDLVRQRFAELRATIDAMVGQIPAASKALGSSITWDWTRWHMGSVTQVARGVHATTYGGEVTFLQNWLRKRIAWIDSDKVGFSRTSMTVRESIGTARLPVTLGGAAKKPATVHYSVSGGSATRGIDYHLPSGTLTFNGTQRTASIPVRIVNDTRHELAETVRVHLSEPSAGTTLGASTFTLTIARSD